MAIGTIPALIGIGTALILNYATVYRTSKLVGDFVFIILGLLSLIPFNDSNYVGIAFVIIMIGMTDTILNVFNKWKRKSNSKDNV